MIKDKDTGEEKEVPYGPYKYNQISDDCFLISHQIHTSYLDLLQITITEREHLKKLVLDEINKQNEAVKKMKAEREARKKK